MQNKLPNNLNLYPFVVTKRLVKHYFKILNKLIFNNELCYFNEVKLIKLKTIHGRVVRNSIHAQVSNYKSGKPKLEIHSTFPTRALFINVLAHEMVHLWQGSSNAIHNKQFFSWRKKFNENNLILAKKY